MEESFRRGQYETQEDGVEYAPSEENDLMAQLREKVRSQAQRLRGLEQYRALCEERIVELCPGHPVPLKPEHLGTQTTSSSPQELHLAKQKIARLEQKLAQQNVKVPLGDNYTFPPPGTNLSVSQLQELYSAIYYQYADAIKDKSALEESLRSEMLISEEQRTYIEVLKQAIETRMEELGYIGTTDDFADFTHSKKTKKETTKLINTIETQETRLKQAMDELREKNNEMTQYAQEREKTDHHLEEAAEALQFAEEEVQRLEEEKAALLEYVDNFSNKEKEYLDKIEKDQEEVNSLVQKLRKLEREVQEEAEKRNSLLRNYETTIHEKDQDLLRLTEQLDGLNLLKDEYENDLESLREQLRALSSKNESLQANNATLSNTLKETQLEMDNLQSEYDSSKSDIKKLKKNLESTQNKLKDIKNSKQQKIQELEEELRYQEKEQKTFKDTLNTLKDEEVRHSVKQLESVQSELQKSWNDYQDLLRRELLLSKETNELKRRDISKQQDIDNLTSENLTLTNEVSELKESFNETNSQLSDYQKRIKELETNITKLKTQLNSEKQRSEILVLENENLKNTSDALTQDLYEKTERLREKDIKIENAVHEIDNLKKSVKLTQEELEKEKYSKRNYYDELCRIKTEVSLIDMHHKENDNFKENIRNYCRIITIFSNNFGAISAATSTYGSVISSDFKDLILKWNANNIEDTSLLHEWVQLASQELEALIRRLADVKQEYSYTSQKLGNTQERFEALAVDEVSLRDREKQLREQVEILNEENSKFIYENDTNVNKIRSLQVELSGVRKDFQNINDENSRLKDQLKLSTSDISQFRNTADSDSFSLKAVEEKTNLLVKEKKELESLLSRLQRAVPSQDLQRIFLDIMKTHSDLEISHRERLRIENQLLRSEAEMRSLARSVQQEKSFQTRKEVESLRIQLNNCDSQIQSYKRRMFNLEEELKELETIERRRFAMNLDTERSFGNSQLRFSNEKTETKHNFDPEMSFNHQETRFTESPMPHFDKLRRSNYDL